MDDITLISAHEHLNASAKPVRLTSISFVPDTSVLGGGKLYQGECKALLKIKKGKREKNTYSQAHIYMVDSI